MKEEAYPIQIVGGVIVDLGKCYYPVLFNSYLFPETCKNNFSVSALFSEVYSNSSNFLDVDIYEHCFQSKCSQCLCILVRCSDTEILRQETQSWYSFRLVVDSNVWLRWLAALSGFVLKPTLYSTRKSMSKVIIWGLSWIIHSRKLSVFSWVPSSKIYLVCSCYKEAEEFSNTRFWLWVSVPGDLSSTWDQSIFLLADEGMLEVRTDIYKNRFYKS